MPWAEVNGTSLRYAFDGDRGPCIVLLHEAGGCIESFDEVAGALGDSFRVLRYDQRGFGFSEPSAELSLDLAVADLTALLDHLALPERIHLAGCALGGDIGAVYARRHGDRVASLVITSPRSEPMDEARSAHLAALRHRIEKEGLRAIRDGYLAGLYPESLRAIDPTRFTQYRARWVCNDASTYACLIPVINQIEASAVYPFLDCETLVLAGTLDTSRPPEMARAVANMIPNGRLQVLETGHFMAVQSPGPFASAVRRFVDEITTRQG